MRIASAAVTTFLWSARSAASFGVAVATSSHPQQRGASMSSRGRTITNALGRLLQSQCPQTHYQSSSILSMASSSLHNRQSAAAAAASPRGGATGSRSSSTALNAAVAAKETAPTEMFRNDYRPLPFTVDEVEMDFQIHTGQTTVTTTMKLQANNPSLMNNDDNDNSDDTTLVLDGDETCVKLQSLKLNGKDLQEGTDYTMAPGSLTLLHVASGDVLESVVEIVPEDNTQLSGLYKDGSMYCTQCEAMGFRRITYYPDRPDNMATFTKVRLEADKDAYPVLLSNGNLDESGDVIDDSSDSSTRRHYAVWSDPFPKPSYLFAAVVGDLGRIQSDYTTSQGRQVHLQVFSERHNVDKLQYAMDSLKRSMKWDEDRFQLAYDLGIYNIVAVDSFNMGAMENKGLNVFNTAYVLADQETATDTDFERVEGVIGHEYFHNWTGNRVTCRDWFQLTLKEGLTVFRDQEFSGDMGSKPVKRIEDVRGLRARQFSEDAGPMSHPIRPESYISMDNFYTGTVYIKGAEVIRMYQTILSPEGFNKGMKLYFERHDGSAVTCDDFLAAMADANGENLEQFAKWYSTSGTPTVKYSSNFDKEEGTFSLTLSQSSNCDTPMHIPVSVGLLDKSTGKEVVPTKVLQLKEDKQMFTFDGLDGDVVPSILRDFSAPVKLEPESGEANEDEMAFLAAYDTDGFNRWDSGQRLYTSLIFQTLDGKKSDKTQGFVDEAFEQALDQKTTDYSIQAYTLILPTESTLAEDLEIVDPVALHKARGSVKKALARKFEPKIRDMYDELTKAMENETEFKVDAENIGRRRLRNTLLEYLCCMRETDEEQAAAAELATAHFEKATGMTDKMAAFNALASMDGKGADARDAAVKKFFDDANGDALVLNKWFTVQALADLPDVLDRVKKLKEHPDFTLKNPNRCRSLISAFSMNSAYFHDEAGAGYDFLGETIAELDELNPQISSRMAGSLIQWRRYSEKRGALMKAELEKLSKRKLSEDLFEIVNRGLSA